MSTVKSSDQGGASILLVYPPVANITQPYLSVPSLVAFLRQQGIERVRSLDLNVSAAHKLLTKERLRRAFRWCYHRLAAWDGKPDRQTTDRFAYLRDALVLGARAVDDIDRAKQVLSKEAYDNPERYVWALHTVLAGYLLLSARYYPTIISHGTLSMRYRCDTSADLLRAVRDEEENPFRELLGALIEEAFAADGIPDVLGISIGYYEQLIPGLTMSALVKERWPGIHVTLGGTMISALYGKTLPPELFDLFDSLVFFEGERPLEKLLRAVGRGEELDGVPNLAFRVRGEVRTTVVERAPVPIDELPPPEFGDLDQVGYFSPCPILPVAASRGCYWRRCTFCSRQHLQETFRQRRPSTVADELVWLQAEHGARHFFFVDECISPSMLGRLADEFLGRELGIEWSCYARFERGLEDPGFCTRLFRAGLRMIYFGLESANERILGLMQKGTPPDRISAILRATSQAGIMNMVLYFVGFPTETKAEALETMRFLEEHREHVAFATAGKFLLEEHSPIFRNPSDFGISQVSPLSDHADLNVICRYQTIDGMTDAEIEATRNQINERTKDLQGAEVLNRSHFLLLGPEYVELSRRRQRLPLAR